MKITDYMGAQITYPDAMSDVEAKEYARDAIQEARQQGKKQELLSMTVLLDGADVLTKQRWKTIHRIRRITGYLSDMNNFGDGKRAEAAERVAHFTVR